MFIDLMFVNRVHGPPPGFAERAKLLASLGRCERYAFRVLGYVPSAASDRRERRRFKTVAEEMRRRIRARRFAFPPDVPLAQMCLEAQQACYRRRLQGRSEVRPNTHAAHVRGVAERSLSVVSY